MQQKHVVYQLTFKNGMRYIGAKTNCTFDEDGHILDNRTNKKYFGSSTSKKMRTLLEEETPTTTILWETYGESKHVFDKEREIIEGHDAIRSPLFFNRFVSPNGSFNWCEYANYKRADGEGEIVRLKRSDPRVLDGTFVGTTKGHSTGRTPSHSKEHQSRMVAASNTPEAISKQKRSYQKWKQNNPEAFQQMCEAASKRTRAMFKGKPKPASQRAKMGKRSKGMRTMVNKITKEVVWVTVEQAKQFSDDWGTPAQARTVKIGKCPHCDKVNDLNAAFKKWHFNNCKERPQ